MAGGAWRIDGGREAGGWQSEAIPSVKEPCENALASRSQVKSYCCKATIVHVRMGICTTGVTV